MIPVLDLRLSEFAPDREAATQRWAAHELYQRNVRDNEQTRRMDEHWAELAKANHERLIQLRLEAIKRGEVYVRPPLYVPRPAYSASSMPYNASGWRAY